MSTTTTKRSLAMACADAIAFRDLFAGCYERWEIAGSVRRQKADVGDIEHVVIPRWGEIAQGGGLFDETVSGSLLWARAEELLKAGVIAKHLYDAAPRWGEKYRGMDYHGFNNEIFCADGDNWGPTLAIRTGPAEFSRMLVTSMQPRGYRNRGGCVWNLRDWTCTCGWVGDHVDFVSTEITDLRNGQDEKLTGGWQEETRQGEKMVAVCLNCRRHDGVKPAKISVPTEQEYFKICGVEWIDPEARR